MDSYTERGAYKILDADVIKSTSSNSSLTENDMVDDVGEKRLDDLTHLEKAEQSDNIRVNKRLRVEDEETDWTLVTGKEKKLKLDKIETYISCSDKFPKQFALARLLKEEGVTGIIRVKYVNPYKIRIDFDDEMSADKLEKCSTFIEMGWKFQRAMERNLSYGTIRDVDLDLSDKEILESITCFSPAEIVSVYRLKRRNTDPNNTNEWVPSETVRVCFKGSFLPTHIFADGLRIRVDPYVFPVSQCSRCWKLGHIAKKCQSIKVICPKCGGTHPNCETKHYKCVNCSGNHMALAKSCPAFVKEKKLRDLMSEFNCTYRKALTIYVPPDSPAQEPNKSDNSLKLSTRFQYFTDYEEPLSENPEPTFADIVKIKADVHKDGNNRVMSPSPGKKQRYKQYSVPEPGPPPAFDSDETPTSSREKSNTNQKREIHFTELLSRLKEIIFLKGGSLQIKIQSVIKCCIEWLILVVVDNIGDWPLLNYILSFING